MALSFLIECVKDVLVIVKMTNFAIKRTENVIMGVKTTGMDIFATVCILIILRINRDINNKDWQLFEISRNLAVPIVKYSQFNLSVIVFH